jgi:hypothetical protein
MAANAGVRRTLPVRRRYLISLSVMGALVCALGSTGLFAALTDSARTGNNHVDTAALPGASDLRIAPAHASAPPTGVGGIIVCDPPFEEDLTTGGFSASDVNPVGFVTPMAWYCVKNVGSQTVGLSATIDSLSDIDLACTGDEALYNDLTCGDQLEGELSSVLQVFYENPFCGDLSMPHSNDVIGMAANVSQTPGGLPSFAGLAPGGELCIGMRVIYPEATPDEDVQRAQSDGVSWRFKFTGVAQN